MPSLAHGPADSRLDDVELFPGAGSRPHEHGSGHAGGHGHEGGGTTEGRGEAGKDAGAPDEPVVTLGRAAAPGRRRRARKRGVRPLAAAGAAAGVAAVTALVVALSGGDGERHDLSGPDGGRALPTVPLPSLTATAEPGSPTGSPTAPGSSSADASSSATASPSGTGTSARASAPASSSAPSGTSAESAPPTWSDNGRPGRGPVLRVGDSGSEVVELQYRLSAAGTYGTRQSDGVFDEDVKDAVARYQAREGIEGDAPGVYGPSTRRALESET
ncbi:hypothetical protein GQS52_19750 [Streptomyces sp. SCUT-3]|uniref:peptidoglycan-binding domain-containing protein n=1 Tax=Streptomyces sp. SCUT-3 TaxID=2684469 RepID=UPI0015F7A692|nr:peptidoglycan-binding domain-containing protein [Streptomyces sp. SCUT-3]QMV23636.1 hypothetical protein GQS52_19750 [Streptomyces sp. SCUT-3]